MSIDQDKKAEIIETFGKNSKDSGSAESQVAILTEKINNITEHLKANKKDHSGRRGLLGLVSKRRKLLKYIKAQRPAQYKEFIEKLKIRK
jgi:small subunit ribosomal protein S15